MNQKINKKAEEIERTKAKIAELQALLPELEREKTGLENTEIVRLVRSANIAPGEVAAFIEAIKKGRQDARLPGANDNAPPASRSQGVMTP